MEKNNEISQSRLEIRMKRLKGDLKEKQDELEKVNEQLKQAISENVKLKRQLRKLEQPKDEYDYGWSWISKIVFLVAQANKPLRSAEIISVLRVREPDLNQKASKEKFLSAFLNVAMQHQRLIPYKLKGVRGNYYCLPEWINEDGELLPEMRRKIY
jgi:chromosome segregation ATPase